MISKNIFSLVISLGFLGSFQGVYSAQNKDAVRPFWPKYSSGALVDYSRENEYKAHEDARMMGNTITYAMQSQGMQRIYNSMYALFHGGHHRNCPSQKSDAQCASEKINDLLSGSNIPAEDGAMADKLIRRERWYTLCNQPCLQQRFYAFYHGHDGAARVWYHCLAKIMEFERQSKLKNFLPVRFWRTTQIYHVFNPYYRSHILFDVYTTSMSTFQDWRKLVRTLQTRPQKILQRNIGLDRLIQNTTSAQLMRSLIDQYTKSEPIFLLLECFGRSCPLNRLRYPARRKQLINKLQCTHIPKNTHIRYVSYGPGALLQDVIFLAHLIPLAQPSHIDIQLIDPTFELCDPTNTHGMRLAHITQTERHLQFGRWLKNTFPMTSSNISYYSDVRHYRSHAKHNEQHTTICLAVDIDTPSENLQDLMNTADICFVVTADNPDVVLCQRK